MGVIEEKKDNAVERTDQMTVTSAMEIEGAEALIAHLRIGDMGFARNVAREMFLAMSGKMSKSRG